MNSRRTSTVTCALCDDEIRPGQPREIHHQETVHTYCARRADARDAYRFYIGNPAEDPRVSFAFYWVDGERDYPILSNSNGLTMYASATAFQDDAIEPTAGFVTAFGLGWHWLMCYRPADQDMLESAFEHIEDFYCEPTMPDHEKWALFNLLGHTLFSEDPLPPEWAPLVAFADECTKLGVPDVAEA